MIKKILFKTFLVFSIFYLTLIFTLPKTEIWYKVEELLFKDEVIIDNEKINENILSLNLSNGIIFFQSLEIAKFQTNSIFLALFYNSIKIKNFHFGVDTANFQNLFFDVLNINYSIFSPTSIYISGNGNFGTLKGVFHIKDNQIDILINPSEILKKKRSIMKNLKKHKKGYIYNAKF
jgi:hypothetical protein